MNTSSVHFCRAETQALQRELAGLSERYSQKCLELNRAEQNSAEREREISRKERDMEQLKKENQVSYQQQITHKSRTSRKVADMLLFLCLYSKKNEIQSR